LTDNEIDKIMEVKAQTQWAKTEVISFFVRRGLKDYKQGNFDNDIAEALVRATFPEYLKTPAFAEAVEKELERRLKEKKNASGEA